MYSSLILLWLMITISCPPITTTTFAINSTFTISFQGSKLTFSTNLVTLPAPTGMPHWTHLPDRTCPAQRFYRATLCVSAVFAVARCLSVCPSVTFVYCIQRAKDIVNLPFQYCSPMILVFFTLCARTQFQGKPLQRGLEIYGVGKICDF